MRLQSHVQYVAAPEVQQKKIASFSSDMYSLGMTICAIYNQGRPLIQANHSCSDYLKQLETVSWFIRDEMILHIVLGNEKKIADDP